MEIPIDRGQREEHHGLVEDRDVQADDRGDQRPALTGRVTHPLLVWWHESRPIRFESRWQTTVWRWEAGRTDRLRLAAIISRTGDTLNFTALPLFVLGLTHAPAAVGAAVFAEGIGLIVGGLLAQSIVDRLAARELLVTLDLLRAAAATLLAIFPTFPMALAVSPLLWLDTASFSHLSVAAWRDSTPDQQARLAAGILSQLHVKDGKISAIRPRPAWIPYFEALLSSRWSRERETSLELSVLHGVRVLAAAA